jgi:hypothetical protein
MLFDCLIDINFSHLYAFEIAGVFQNMTKNYTVELTRQILSHVKKKV